MDYFSVAMAAVNEVSASTWIQWAQGSSLLGCVAVTAVLTWVVRDLWHRVDFLWTQGPDAFEFYELQERVSELAGSIDQTRAQVAKHEQMLAHMQRMRDAKAAKRAAKVA